MKYLKIMLVIGFGLSLAACGRMQKNAYAYLQHDKTITPVVVSNTQAAALHSYYPVPVEAHSAAQAAPSLLPPGGNVAHMKQWLQEGRKITHVGIQPR